MMQKVIREGGVRKVFIIGAISATCMVCLKQRCMSEHINHVWRSASCYTGQILEVESLKTHNAE